MYLKVRTCTRFLHLKAEGLTYFFALRSLDPKLTGWAVTESLTKRRLSLLNEAKSLLGDKNVWTYKGSVFTNINSKHEKIVSQEAFYNLVTELGD